MSEDLYTRWKDKVTRVAANVSRDYPDVEAEDIEQDLWLIILEKGWTEPGDKSVTTILKRVARGKANQYRAEHLTASPQYAYRPSEVRSFLYRIFDYDYWIQYSAPTSSNREGEEWPQWGLANYWGVAEDFNNNGHFNRLPKAVGADGDMMLIGGVSAPDMDYDDRLSVLIDVKRVWERLPKNARRIIFEKYALGYEFEKSSAKERQLIRAVDRLTGLLNSYSGTARPRRKVVLG